MTTVAASVDYKQKEQSIKNSQQEIDKSFSQGLNSSAINNSTQPAVNITLNILKLPIGTCISLWGTKSSFKYGILCKELTE